VHDEIDGGAKTMTPCTLARDLVDFMAGDEIFKVHEFCKLIKI
jgi:hypothetical protein